MLVSLIWVIVGGILIHDDGLKVFTAFLAFLAFVLSLLTFGLKESPTLIVRGLSISKDRQKIYLNVGNTGTIGAWNIEGAYAFTSCAEKGDGTVTDERSVLFDAFKVSSEAFYPGSEHMIVLRPAKPIPEFSDHTFFSIVFTYPRLEIWKIKLDGPLARGFQGVFLEVEKEIDKKLQKVWVRHSKTHYPEHFKKVFEALLVKKPQAPEFPKIEVPGKEKVDG